jgi:hypothetical protein
MKALVLSGAASDDVTLAAIARCLERELEGHDWTVESWFLRSSDIAYCRGCYDCWKTTPGDCTTDDDGRRVAQALIGSDLLVLLTPVTFGGYSSALKKALDRLIPDISPWMTAVDGETHHKPRYARYPDLLAIGTLPVPDPDLERTFVTLVARNAINFHAASHAAAVVADGAPEAVLELRVTSLLTEMGVATEQAGSLDAGRETAG